MIITGKRCHSRPISATLTRASHVALRHKETNKRNLRDFILHGKQAPLITGAMEDTLEQRAKADNVATSPLATDDSGNVPPGVLGQIAGQIAAVGRAENPTKRRAASPLARDPSSTAPNQYIQMSNSVPAHVRDSMNSAKPNPSTTINPGDSSSASQKYTTDTPSRKKARLGHAEPTKQRSPSPPATENRGDSPSISEEITEVRKDRRSGRANDETWKFLAKWTTLDPLEWPTT